MRKILVIDDEAALCELISSVADGMGLDCTTATDTDGFLTALTPEVDLILLDLKMPQTDGIELLRLLGRRECRVGIVLVSGVGKRIMETAQAMAESLGLKIVGRLQKPFRISDLEEELGKHVRPMIAPAVAHRLELAIDDAELRRAVEQDEFEVHYQPQVEIATGVIVGVEALVRWRHPDRGLIFPDKFISRMEKLQLIDDLGWLVTARAMSDIGMFAVEQRPIPKLSVNVSMYSLHDLFFPDRLEELAGRYAVPLSGLVLEITESGFIQELARTLDVLVRLRMKNVHLSIDDFGTGYSGMQHLRNIPATELKIDKSFVQSIEDHDGDRVLVLKTIEIGHELEMKVVAEGVETAAQLEFLRANHCDVAQGYLFSHPLAPEKLLEWLTQYRANSGVRPV
jgi:EAL domain-containing protein (putative c-di-GMP-specific phosphodiesterase class I)/FixJ family two-component response regulator